MKITWKRDYGDHELTDDAVLWINGEPTENCVSGINGCQFAYVGHREIGVYDTRKDCKEAILEELGIQA